MGDYGWYKEKVGEALATQRALAKNFSRNADTLYVHADTLRLFSYDLRTDSAYRVLHGYFHVRAYRTDVQAVCDSLVFNSKQHRLTLYRDPIAWSGDRQILGEEINVYTNDIYDLTPSTWSANLSSCNNCRIHYTSTKYLGIY